MNKCRYVEAKAPPVTATSADIRRAVEEMCKRSWAGIAKPPIVVKGTRKKR